MPTQTFQPTNTPIDISKYQREYERGRTEIIRGLVEEGRGRRALDVGAGPGYFTRMLHERGWRVTSVDTDPRNLESAVRFADGVRLGDAISVLATLPDGQLDLVLLLELIEHMPEEQGVEMLRHVARALDPDGFVILSTPNRFSLEGLGGYYWGEKLRGWGRWEAWDPTHVRIYSSREILNLLERCGFRVESVTGYWYRGHIPGLGLWKLPIRKSSVFPWNRLGFDVIIGARRAPRSYKSDANTAR